MKAVKQKLGGPAAAPGPEEILTFLHWLRYRFHRSVSASAFLFEWMLAREMNEVKCLLQKYFGQDYFLQNRS